MKLINSQVPVIALIILTLISAHLANVRVKNYLLEKFISSTKSQIQKSQEAALTPEAAWKQQQKSYLPNRGDNDQIAESEKADSPQPTNDLATIEKYAEFASQKTGVSKDFLMGMLVVESNLGKNTGQCTYREVEEGAFNSRLRGRLSDRAWNTFLRRKELIHYIANRLQYNPQELKVSCNPAGYAGTGGAMGPGQFMPDTWLEYKDRVAELVGTDTPDPWNPRDGIMAMALKVADVPGVTQKNAWSERAASKLYLSGTTSWQYNWYANQIQYWKNNYKSLFGRTA